MRNPFGTFSYSPRSGLLYQPSRIEHITLSPKFLVSDPAHWMVLVPAGIGVIRKLMEKKA
jgi:hypothetical protein